MHEYLMVMRKFGVLSGRARRREYWMFVLVNGGITLVLHGLDRVLNLNLPASDATALASFGLLSALYTVFTSVAALAAQVRRLHDAGRSGWWWMLNFVPVLGNLIVLVFLLTDSQPGDNRWGPNSKVHRGAGVATLA